MEIVGDEQPADLTDPDIQSTIKGTTDYYSYPPGGV